jgi:DNA-binding SARP family transcriptional activator
MAQLSLCVLGSMQITRDGAPLSGLESAKVRALLIYLAVEAAHSHSREAIAALLWPEQPALAAHHNLRQALTNLRQSLGDRSAARPLLLITRETIQLNPHSDYEFDAARFSDLLAACETHAHRRADTCWTCTQRRVQAAALYGGDFLAHFSPRDSAPWARWYF